MGEAMSVGERIAEFERAIREQCRLRGTGSPITRDYRPCDRAVDWARKALAGALAAQGAPADPQRGQACAGAGAVAVRREIAEHALFLIEQRNHQRGDIPFESVTDVFAKELRAALAAGRAGEGAGG